MARLLAGFVLVAAEVGPTASGVLAVDPKPSAPPSQIDVGTLTDGPVAPIDYIFPAGQGGFGAADPSVGLRPVFEAAERPAAKTAVEEAWSRDRRVWANPDGTYTVEAGERLNYQPTNRPWTPIDLTLVGKDGTYSPAAAPTDLALMTGSADGTLAILKGDAGEVALRLVDPVTGTKADDRIAFDSIAAEPDVFVRPTDSGFEFGATLVDASVARAVAFILDVGSLEASVDEDGYTIILTDPTSDSLEPAGRISAPSVLDGEEREADISVVSVALEPRADGTYLLAYEIDEKWLLASDRVFPVTLDPTVCIRNGYTGCAYQTATDIWYGDGQPSLWVTPSTTDYLHVGWYLGTGSPWGQTRSVLYFPGVDLVDGAMVTAATLQLRQNYNYSGGLTPRIYARLVNKPSGWTPGTSSTSWNSLASAVTSGYDSPSVAPCEPGGTDCTLDLDVTKIVRAWYTRRGQDWRANAGFQVRYVTEGTSHALDGISFYRSTWSSTGARPLLSITYELPGVEIDFDSALGPTYAPSAMVKDQATRLPVRLKNNSSYTYDSNYRLGWRLFDMTGALKQSGLTNLPGDVDSGELTDPFAVSITPTASGQFSLRLDLVKVVGGVSMYASDWAKPALFYSRNKKVLTSDSTRWTGSSVIERDEFGIKVIAGQGSVGESRGVATGDGGQLSINLWSKNLGYAGDTGLGFGDRMPVTLTYGYNSKAAADCTVYLGALGACGWYTNWDERVTAGSSTGDFTYYDSAGGAHLIDSDSVGQLIGAPVQLSRVRATLFDENRPSAGGSLVAASGESPEIPTISGPSIVRTPATGTTSLSGFSPSGEIRLNTYRTIDFSIRTTDAASAAICFLISNHTTGAEHDICLIVGPDFAPGSDYRFVLSTSTPTDTWRTVSTDLWNLVSGTAGYFGGGFGATTDEYFIKNVYTKSSSSTGYIYFDRLVASQRQIWALATASTPAWTSGSSTNNTTEYVGTLSHQISSSVTCDAACFSGQAVGGASLASLQAAPIARWWWKKAGGNSVSIELFFTDLRSGGPAPSSIVYYAGALPPGAVPSRSVRISATVPDHFTRVTRNILEDARQILNYYNDVQVGGTSDSVPSQGPTADAVRWTKFVASAVDGNYLLLDKFELVSGPEWADLNRYADKDIVATYDNFSYDFQAEHPDGTTHYFNRDGLLTRIVDSHQQRIDLDWTYASTGTGPAAYTLTAIHAPADATVNGGDTYNRQIDVTKTTPSGFNLWTFTERLGTLATPIPGRRADFWVATATGTTWGIKDLVKVSPARHNSATCGTAPSGCVELEYSSNTSHLVKRVSDPRRDATTDARLEVTWASGNPTEILDKSHGDAALLRVISFDRGLTNSPLYLRPLYQDAAAAAAGYAMHLDLAPDGSVKTEYIRQGPCAANDCSTNKPSDTGATLNDRKAAEYAYDGLAHFSTITRYRCPAVVVDGCTGTTALASLERRGTNAGAKVENWSDALAAAEVAWTQSADQYFASMRDSGGKDPDLYRDEYRYNGVHAPILVTSPVINRASDYPATVRSAGSQTGYWRLGDGSSPLADSSGNGNSGTGTSLTYGQAGAIARDANTAISFNGSSSKITSPAAVSTTAYSIEAWVRLPSIPSSEVLIAGRWSANLGARLYIDSSATFAFGHNATSISATSAGWYPEVDRWYYVVGTWDSATAKLWVDGVLLAQAAVTGNTGTGGSTFNIGSYGSTGYLNGVVDEVVLRATAVDGPTIRAAYQAGRGIASVRSETTYGGTTGTLVYHLDAHPTQSAVQAIANGDFAQGLSEWTRSSTATYDGTGIRLPTSATATQVAQLVPGQRVHFQVSGRTDGTSGSTARLRLSYWQVSSASWVDLVDDSIANTTSWTTRAFQYTIPPTDTTGLVRVSLSDGSGIGEARFDDVLLVTAWQSFGYRGRVDVAVSGTTPRYLQDGLLEKVTSFDHASSIMTQQRVFSATTSHPAILATSVIENYVDGTAGPGADADVTTTVSYDGWGRILTSIDPDGVDSETVYAANMTDVARTEDGLDQPTTFTYDGVGNVLTTTSPLGRATSSTFDARNQVLTTTGPDGVVSRTDYDSYGRATATWENWIDGNPTNGDGTDDLLTLFAYDEYGRVKLQDAECGSVGACATNGLDARTVMTYDLLGNAVTRTVYAGTDASLPRVTTSYFETYPSSNPTHSAVRPSGTLLPIAPGTSAPFCPGSSSVRCNVASVWTLNGATVSGVDMNGHAYASTDAYGIVTLTDVDIAGKPVALTAAYVAGGAATSDQNVVTRTEYNMLGDPIVTWDAAGRRDVRSYDVLGRLLSVSHRTTTGSEYLLESTVYRPSGRVDRTSDGASWTRTLYDGAGRAIRTIANYDTSGKAGMTLDALEGTAGAWSIAASGFFTTNPAAARTDDTDLLPSATAGNAYHAVAPVSGRGRLHVTTSDGSAASGTWVDLSGPTYQSGHVYKASFDLVTGAATALTAYLGQDQGGGSYGTLSIPGSPTTWTRYTVSWTAGSNLTTPIHFAITKTAAGTAHLYLDNLVVWDSTAGWTDKGIVSSVSAYSADGEIIASVLPPGDPATERPLVTTVAFDPAGRTVESVTNGASGAYAATVLGAASLAAYIPLDERTGTTAADKKAGGTALTVPATLTLGVAGAIDEARTGIRLTGTNGYPSRTSNATSATANVSMEAWIRTDTTPGSTVVVAANGSAAAGWGIGIGATGVAAGFAISGSTLTTMASTVTVTDGAWHHLVLTRGESTWAMTIDGAPVTLSNSTTNPGTPGASSTFGALSDGTRPFVGEVDEVSVYTADISGATAAAHLAAGRRTDTTTALTTRNAYDRLGRLSDAWAPDLVRTHAGYDRLGNQVETIANYRDGTTTGGTAADDVRSTFAYDVAGELIGYCPAVEVKAGGCTPSDSNEVQAWRYGFDALGRQITTIPPVNTAAVALTTEEVVYEAGGRLARTCRYPAGGSCGAYDSRHVDFTYDNLGRILTQKTYDRGANPAADVLKFTKTLTWNADGSPATVNEGSDTLTYTYDTAGRVSQFKRGSTVLTAYTYTADTSTIATRTDGTQGATAFTYDWARRQTVIDPPDAYVAGTVTRSYRLDGLLATQAFPSSITETLAYDAAKRPVSIGLGSAGSISQAFDRAGRVTSDGRSLAGISGDAGTGTQSFSYDNLSRLTGSTGLAVSRSYQYDLDGNRTARTEGGTTTTFSYDRADQVIGQVIGGTTRTFDYDRYGNLLTSADNASAVTTYAYDEANRLVTISPPGGAATQVTFTLDALGRHATRALGSPAVTTDTYAYLAASETAWSTGQGTPTAALLDADGTRLAVKTGSTVSWLVFDLHGSVAALCSTSGSLTDAYRFDGFGQQIDASGSATNPWRYRGLLNIGSDALTGALLDMGARDYSPQLGAFTQQDSVQGAAANPLTMNRFLYALANPATLIDPDGHEGFDPFGFIGDVVSNVVDFGSGVVEGAANTVVSTVVGVAELAVGAADMAISAGGCARSDRCRDAAISAIGAGVQAFGQDPAGSISSVASAVVQGVGYVAKGIGDAAHAALDNASHAWETGNWHELGRITGSTATSVAMLATAGGGAIGLAGRAARSVGLGGAVDAVGAARGAVGLFGSKITTSAGQIASKVGALADRAMFGTLPRVFWSGRGMQAAATTWAKDNAATTLGMTRLGRSINSVGRIPKVGPFLTARLWPWASGLYGRGARGVVRTAIHEPRPGSIWRTVEEPILKASGSRVTIIPLKLGPR